MTDQHSKTSTEISVYLEQLAGYLELGYSPIGAQEEDGFNIVQEEGVAQNNLNHTT